MKIKKITILLVLCLGLSLIFLGCGQTGKNDVAKQGENSEQKEQTEQSKREEVYTLTFGHNGTPDTSIAEVYDVFKGKVEEKSNGRLIIDLHGSGSIGDDIAVVEGARMGTVDIASSSAANLGNWTEAYFPFELPYIFKSVENVSEIFSRDTELGKKVIDQVERDVNVKYLFIHSSGGMRHLINSDKPVRVPEDAKGLKLRATFSPMEQEIIKSFGCIPTPITSAEVYGALQQNVIDGVHNPYMWTFTTGWYERLKYITEINATPIFHVVVMSKSKFDSLPKDLQDILMETSKEMDVEGTKIDIKYMDNFKQKMIDAGLEVYVPTEEEMEKWRNATNKVWEDKSSEFDPAMIKLIEELR